MNIEKNEAPKSSKMALFLKNISFKLPKGFVNFYEQSNGANISTEEQYILLWPLTKMLQLNLDYNVEEYAPEFFIFGTNGGDTAFSIEKSTGKIFEMPFIGMSKEEAIFISDTFDDFLSLL